MLKIIFQKFQEKKNKYKFKFLNFLLNTEF